MPVRSVALAVVVICCGVIVPSAALAQSNPPPVVGQNLQSPAEVQFIRLNAARSPALVACDWNPGPGREPAPGSQEAAGKLVQAWIDTGAECPLSPPSINPQ